MNAIERIGELPNEFLELGLKDHPPRHHDIIEVVPGVGHLHALDRRFQTRG